MPRFNFTNNGASDEFELSPGKHAMEVSGTFDSGSVVLQTNRGAGWINVPNTSFVANGQVIFDIDAVKCRVSVTDVAVAAANLAVIVH